MNILKLSTKERVTGNIGEDYAAKFLKKSGYKILERNYVKINHEIDIIASNKKHLVFVEVKTRTIRDSKADIPRPALAVSREQMRNIMAVAKIYAAFHPSKREMRFDIIEIYLNGAGEVTKCEHIESAFNADSVKGRP